MDEKQSLTLTRAGIVQSNLMWLIMWVCSRVDFVLFLSPAILNPSRNNKRNKNTCSTRYKVIIQFWKLSIANQGESNIDKKHVQTFARFC